MIKSLKLIFLALMVSACVSTNNQNYIEREAINQVQAKEKAFIVLGTRIVANPGVSKTFDLTWQNNQANKKLVTKNYASMYVNSPFVGGDYRFKHSYEFYVVEPGEYNLALIKHIISTSAYSSIATSNLAKFNLQGGDVVYLGDITFNIRDYKFKHKNLKKIITVDNKYDESKAFLAKYFPELAANFKKHEKPILQVD